MTTPADPTDPAVDPAPLQRTRMRALGFAAALLVAAAALTAVVAVDPTAPALQRLDDSWDTFMRAHRSPWLTDVSQALSVVGSSIVTWPVRAGAALILFARRRFTQLAAFATAVGLAELCTGPLKWAIGRPRPPAPLVDTTNYSFPSGHAIAAAVTAFGLVVAFLPRSRARLWWTGVAAAFAAAMAVSRTYLAAHWLSDTVAGVLIGVGLALGAEALFEQTRTKAVEVVEGAAVAAAVAESEAGTPRR